MTPAFLITFDFINKIVIGNEVKNPVNSELGFVGLKRFQDYYILIIKSLNHINSNSDKNGII
jgi:hypothetical protein